MAVTWTGALPFLLGGGHREATASVGFTSYQWVIEYHCDGV